jgi:glycosyltransferase involved in cell wall biosynthesis
MEASVPRLSIVIPAYNVSAFIIAAVQSALDQTFRELEVIVVNDGSTDETAAKLARLAELRCDPRLKIVYQENGGLSAARNVGIAEARGHYVGFLDGDDVWREDKAAAHVALMDSDPTIGISFSDSELLEEDGTRTHRIQRADKLRPSLHDMILRNHVGNGSTPVVLRSCFEAVGMFREDLRSCEDYEMWCRILWKTDTIAVGLPDALTYYRMRKSSLSFDINRFVQQADLALEVIQSSMREIPSSVLLRARAEHYRIAANKAIIAGKRTSARRLLVKVFKLRPLLFLTNLRAVATLAAVLLPETQMRRLQHFVVSCRSKRA